MKTRKNCKNRSFVNKITGESNGNDFENMFDIFIFDH